MLQLVTRLVTNSDKGTLPKKSTSIALSLKHRSVCQFFSPYWLTPSEKLKELRAERIALSSFFLGGGGCWRTPMCVAAAAGLVFLHVAHNAKLGVLDEVENIIYL